MMAFILKDWAKLPNRPRFGRIASVWASSEPYLRPKVRDGGIDKFLNFLDMFWIPSLDYDVTLRAEDDILSTCHPQLQVCEQPDLLIYWLADR